MPDAVVTGRRQTAKVPALAALPSHQALQQILYPPVVFHGLSAADSDGFAASLPAPNGKYPDALATACGLSPLIPHNAARAAHDVAVNERPAVQ